MSQREYTSVLWLVLLDEGVLVILYRYLILYKHYPVT